MAWTLPTKLRLTLILNSQSDDQLLAALKFDRMPSFCSPVFTSLADAVTEARLLFQEKVATLYIILFTQQSIKKPTRKEGKERKRKKRKEKEGATQKKQTKLTN